MLRELLKRWLFEEPEVELEEEAPDIEYGTAVSDIREDSLKLLTCRVRELKIEDLIDYKCPRCGCFLLSADKASRGIVAADCRKCKRTIAVELGSLSSNKVGFKP